MSFFIEAFNKYSVNELFASKAFKRNSCNELFPSRAFNRVALLHEEDHVPWAG